MWFLIGVYLSAIVLANWATAEFGPSAAIINAFLFIGLDLSSRDALHEHWQRDHLRRNMALLIVAGSGLSWLLNQGAGRIALASLAAFTLASAADTVIYALLHRRGKLTRMNGSNLVGAAVDSVVFPALAFGLPLLPAVMLGQFVAKIMGGLVWSILLSCRFYSTAGSTKPHGTIIR